MSDCRFGVSPVNYPDPDPESYLVANSEDKFSCDMAQISVRVYTFLQFRLHLLAALLYGKATLFKF